MTTFVRRPWERLGISKASYYRRLKVDPSLPKLIKIFGPDGRAVGADDDELDAYQRARKAERDGGSPKAA
jgi:predicted DNA-binding transcriptional regulator AlpA